MGNYAGDWTEDGPNEHFDIIKEEAFSFLFDIIYPFQLGDVDNDGSLNFLDISTLSSIITGYNNEFEPYYTDMNFDDNTDIYDLIILIDMVTI